MTQPDYGRRLLERHQELQMFKQEEHRGLALRFTNMVSRTSVCNKMQLQQISGGK